MHYVYMAIFVRAGARNGGWFPIPGRPFIPDSAEILCRVEGSSVAPGRGRKSADNMHSASSKFVFNVLSNERRRLIIQMDECAVDARRSRRVRFIASYPFRFRRRRFRFSDVCLLAWRARDRSEDKSKDEEKDETERRERNVVNNVMKFLRWVETRRRHLSRDFMKSLNSPARKDIIKFPTAKFALPSPLPPSCPPAHLFVPSSSGSADTSALHVPPLPLARANRIIKSNK